MPVSVMNDLGMVQEVRKGFSLVFLTGAPFIYEKLVRRFAGNEGKSLHNVAFHSDLCLGITMADTASVLGLKARRLLMPTQSRKKRGMQ